MTMKFNKEWTKEDIPVKHRKTIKKIVSLLEELRGFGGGGWIPAGIAEDTLMDFAKSFEKEGIATCKWRN
jgi:hypothetical protein